MRGAAPCPLTNPTLYEDVHMHICAPSACPASVPLFTPECPISVPLFAIKWNSDAGGCHSLAMAGSAAGMPAGTAVSEEDRRQTSSAGCREPPSPGQRHQQRRRVFEIPLRQRRLRVIETVGCPKGVEWYGVLAVF